MSKQYKIRWNNGYGYEDGTSVPYSFYLEDRETKERIQLMPNKVIEFLEQYNYTIKDFRDSNERKLTQYIVDNLEQFAIIKKHYRINADVTLDDLKKIEAKLEAGETEFTIDGVVYFVSEKENNILFVEANDLDKIKARMQALNITGYQLAKQIGISRTSMYAMLNGTTKLSRRIRDELYLILGL